MIRQSRLMGSAGLAAIAASIFGTNNKRVEAMEVAEGIASAAVMSAGNRSRIGGFASGVPMPHRLPNQRQRRKTARQVNRFPKRKSR